MIIYTVNHMQTNFIIKLKQYIYIYDSLLNHNFQNSQEEVIFPWLGSPALDGEVTDALTRHQVIGEPPSHVEASDDLRTHMDLKKRRGWFLLEVFCLFFSWDCFWITEFETNKIK